MSHAPDILAAVQGGIMALGVVSLALMAAGAVAWLLRNAFAWAVRRIPRGAAVPLAVAAAVCCWAAQKRLVTYPRTDPTQTYLTDRGSWVDGDLVHVDFSRIIVPDSATMYIDRMEIGAEDARWVPHLIAAFGDIVLPLEFTHENATNYQWIVYTDWTPGPSVQTNGVWHAMWGRDRVRGAYVIPLRTAVRVDGDTIATPKSREDAKHE